MKISQTMENGQKTKSNIGLKIQKLLDHHNIGVSKVANATGLTSETIRQIINGTIKNPGIETLSKIADAFSITLYDLLETKVSLSQVSKKKIKIIDIFDFQKLTPEMKIEDLINQSVQSVEILHIDTNVFDSDFFALQVNNNLAGKLTNCGMPMLKEGDLLIFAKNGNISINSLILVKFNSDMVTLGIVMEVDSTNLWIKSVDIPQKQVVTKIQRSNVIGVVHNVQFVK